MVQWVISIKKTENKIFKIISPDNLLKRFVNKNMNKDYLSFHFPSISEKLTIKDKKNP